MNAWMSLLVLPSLVIGLSLHEFAHAWSASLLGDDFARRQGRVSLNPLRHLSLLGTLAILLLPFGWAKPVPVNVYNFRHPKRDYLLTSLAGPAANVLVVLACAGLAHLTRHSYAFGSNPAWMSVAHSFVELTALINAILAAVNLLPVPPLDGSKIWPVLIPPLKLAFRKGTIVMLVGLVLLLQSGAMNGFFDFAVRTVNRIIPVSDYQRLQAYLDDAHRCSLRGQAQRAELLLTAALSINPACDEALAGRARARTMQGNLRAALADVERAIAIRPTLEYEALRATILRKLTDEQASLLAEPQSQPAHSQPLEAQQQPEGGCE
jgi:Zn-dependent protease